MLHAARPLQGVAEAGSSRPDAPCPARQSRTRGSGRARRSWTTRSCGPRLARFPRAGREERSPRGCAAASSGCVRRSLFAAMLDEESDSHTVETFLVHAQRPPGCSGVVAPSNLPIGAEHCRAGAQGLAHFSPTGPTRFLDSAASQTR